MTKILVFFNRVVLKILWSGFGIKQHILLVVTASNDLHSSFGCFWGGADKCLVARDELSEGYFGNPPAVRTNFFSAWELAISTQGGDGLF